jgi:hypothetical protein
MTASGPMKLDEYTTELNGKHVSFYHNQKNHKMEIWIDREPYVVTLAKGQAIIDFLKLISA